MSDWRETAQEFFDERAATRSNIDPLCALPTDVAALARLLGIAHRKGWAERGEADAALVRQPIQGFLDGLTAHEERAFCEVLRQIPGALERGIRAVPYPQEARDEMRHRLRQGEPT